MWPNDSAKYCVFTFIIQWAEYKSDSAQSTGGSAAKMKDQHVSAGVFVVHQEEHLYDKHTHDHHLLFVFSLNSAVVIK